MMLRRLLTGVVSVACILLVMAWMPGCSKQQSPEKKPQNALQQGKSEVSESFTKMVAGTEMLVVDLSGKTKNIQIQGMGEQTDQNGAVNQNTQGQTATTQGQQQGQQNQTGQQGQQQKQGQSQQSGQQAQTTQTGQGQNTAQQTNQKQVQANTTQPSDSDWGQTQKTLKDLHQNWNSLEPDVARAGLTMEARDGFEKALEDLTRNVAAKNSKASLIGAIETYKAFSDMANVLKTELPPSYYRLKYLLMAATAQAGMDKWEAAKDHAAGFKQQNEMLKTREQESTAQMFAQLDHALNDLYRAIEIKERDLVMIKSEIAMKNLEQLKQKLTEGQSQQQNGTGQSQ